MKAYLGIEIGGTKLQIVVGDENLCIIERFRFEINREKGATDIREKITKTVTNSLVNYSIQSAGIGFGGPVDWQTGQIARSYHVEGWSNFSISNWLSGLINAPVFVENDGNIAAFGEAIYGAGKDKNPVFYVTMGTGVGAGLVVDGKIYHGQKPGEAEFGHIRLDKSGTVLQDVCSGIAIDAKIRQLIDKSHNSILKSLVGNQAKEARFLKMALGQGDEEAKKILAETAENMAFALSHAVHLFHPEVIIIGGGLSLMGEILTNTMAHYLPHFLMDAFLPAPPIVLAALGEDVVPIGALALAKTKLIVIG